MTSIWLACAIYALILAARFVAADIRNLPKE